LKRFFVIQAASDYVGDTVIARLREAHSTEQCDHLLYHVRVQDSSPEYAAIITILNDAGCVPYERGSEYGPGRFKHRANFEYEPKDYASADLFRMIPAHQLTHVDGRNEDQQLRINVKSAKGKADLLTTHGGALLASESLKADLEAENFIGLAFRPTVLVKGDYGTKFEELPWSKARRSRLWELTASLVLPPMAHRLRREGRPLSPNDQEWVDGEWQDGYVFEHGEYDGRPSFRGEAVEAMGLFDFALTYEPFGTAAEGKSPHMRALLMKRRAYDFIRKRFKRTYWLPFYLTDK
jgi:hypothetical protein